MDILAHLQPITLLLALQKIHRFSGTIPHLTKSALKIIAFMELCINNVTVYMYSNSQGGNHES